MRKSDYDRNYMKTNCRVYRLQLNKENDADIIALLETRGNINGFLKAVLRHYIQYRNEYGEELFFGREKK